MESGLSQGEDGLSRCSWSSASELYRNYHDEEWGWPVSSDQRLFEKICLEAFQAGLSWITILKKRENFRKAFCDFDMEKVACFGSADVKRLLEDKGIVRNKMKIEACIHNASRAIALVEEVGSLSNYFWKFEPSPADRPDVMSWSQIKELTQTEESKALSKDLKKRQWKFVGPTTSYAFMQAMGLVNDHVDGCHMRPKITQARKAFGR